MLNSESRKKIFSDRNSSIRRKLNIHLTCIALWNIGYKAARLIKKNCDLNSTVHMILIQLFCD